jgi:hypothetical protein
MSFRVLQLSCYPTKRSVSSKRLVGSKDSTGFPQAENPAKTEEIVPESSQHALRDAKRLYSTPVMARVPAGFGRLVARRT